MFNGERFDFKILSVLRLGFSPSERYSPARRYHALVFRIRGKAEVVKGGDRVRLNKNDVTFVPRGYDYTICTHTDEEVIVIHFEAAFSSAPAFSNLHATNPDAFSVLFEKLLSAWQTQPCGYLYRIDALFLSVLEQIEKQTLALRADSLLFRMQHAADVMHERLGDAELSIDALAAETGYCSSYFRRAFAEEMGSPPKEYLIALRIRHALALLESGYYTIEQVAELSGFTSAKYFSTAFKRVMKKSPSDYLPRRRK